MNAGIRYSHKSRITVEVLGVHSNFTKAIINRTLGRPPPPLVSWESSYQSSAVLVVKELQPEEFLLPPPLPLRLPCRVSSSWSCGSPDMRI